MPAESSIDCCPHSAAISAALRGELPTGELARLLRHAAECEQCLAELRTGEIAYEPSRPERPTGKDTVSGDYRTPAGGATATHHESVGAFDAARTATISPAPSWQGMLAPAQCSDELGRLGSYRILRVLGEGGMGVVFEAEDTALGRRVAVKVLRSADIDAAQRKRFVQEAQLAASLSSDHIVTIHQVSEDAGCLFIVMELLRGETLDERLRREGSLPLIEALRIGREIAEGLAVAHERQLVHRDIKPANVWLEARRLDEPLRRVKLLDFGVARALALHEHLTLGGQVIGTPAYMSPEQACGTAVDQRADLFSLGCLMYAMLAGKSPFEKSSYLHVLRAVVEERPASLSEIMPGMPARIVRLIDRLLEKNPQLRPASARCVADEIRLLEQSLTSSGMIPPVIALPNGVHGDRLRRKLGWSAAAGALTILAAVVVGLLSQYQHVLTHSKGEAPNRVEQSVAGAEASAAVAAMRGAAAAVVNLESSARESETSGTPPANGASSTPATVDGQSPDKEETPPAAASPDLPPIKIGIVHSLTGPMAASERPIVDALLMAVDEINESGGLLDGRRIEAIVRDGKSHETHFAEQAEDLIETEKVVTLFGCWRSPCRKLVEAVCERHDHLLVYSCTYEGMEDSPYVIYLGGAPNQQILPAVKYAFAFLGKRRFYLIGVDGIYSHTVHEIIRDELASLGGVVVGESYRPLGATNFADIAQQVVSSKADMVINTVSGTGNMSLFACLREAGIKSAEVPTLSFTVTEEELQTIAAHDSDLVGDYAAWSYFQTISNADNEGFLERLHVRYGPTRVATDPMAVSYASVYLWARAVEASQSDRTPDIRAAMLTQAFEAPEGELIVDEENRHAWRQPMLGQVAEDLQFDIVWSSPRAIAPEPFPASRSREQWEEFQEALYHKWGDRWFPMDGSRANEEPAQRRRTSQ